MMNLLVTLLTLTLCGHWVKAWPQELRDFALKFHNDMRAGIGACQMNALEYDLDLEKQAEKWALNCVFEHESIKGRGENLAWNTKKIDEKDLMTTASQAWYDEVKMYKYGQYSCGMSCHYTQLVWATTTKVGCSTTRCANLKNAYTDAWYFVCFYSPGGNMNGEKPYQTTCDSKCQLGQTEDANGLCLGEATIVEVETTTTTSTEKPCEDKDSRCTTWAKQNFCRTNFSWMRTNCEYSCGYCGDICIDRHPKCKRWADDDMCDKNPDYMHRECRIACGDCS